MNNHVGGMNEIDVCCAECGNEGGAGLKTCKACMLVKYCNADCQKKHWQKHKSPCKERVAELRDEALFKDPPPKEDCPICFLPMPAQLICCISLPPATILSVPIFDFAMANKEIVDEATDLYYSCCGKSICLGCIHSFRKTGNDDKCPFCNSDRAGKTDRDIGEETRKRVAANDAASICMLADSYHNGLNGLQQDHAKAMELYVRAADLGCCTSHNNLGVIYDEGGNLKKAKFHFEIGAMAGHEGARYNLGGLEVKSGNMERAIKHWTIAASAGDYDAMQQLRTFFEKSAISRESIDSTLAAYNNSCAEMRSEARDARIKFLIEIG
jgi:hypothetical protein